MLRKLILLILAVSSVSLCWAQPRYNASYLNRQNEAFNNLFTDMTDNGWLYFKKDMPEPVSPKTFLQKYAANLGLSEGYEMILIRDEMDDDPEIEQKMKHQLFLLHYKGVPVEWG